MRMVIVGFWGERGSYNGVRRHRCAFGIVGFWGERGSYNFLMWAAARPEPSPTSKSWRSARRQEKAQAELFRFSQNTCGVKTAFSGRYLLENAGFAPQVFQLERDDGKKS